MHEREIKNPALPDPDNSLCDAIEIVRDKFIALLGREANVITSWGPRGRDHLRVRIKDVVFSVLVDIDETNTQSRLTPEMTSRHAAYCAEFNQIAVLARVKKFGGRLMTEDFVALEDHQGVTVNIRSRVDAATGHAAITPIDLLDRALEVAIASLTALSWEVLDAGDDSDGSCYATALLDGVQMTWAIAAGHLTPSAGTGPAICVNFRTFTGSEPAYRTDRLVAAITIAPLSDPPSR